MVPGTDVSAVTPAGRAPKLSRSSAATNPLVTVTVAPVRSGFPAATPTPGSAGVAPTRVKVPLPLGTLTVTVSVPAFTSTSATLTPVIATEPLVLTTNGPVGTVLTGALLTAVTVTVLVPATLVRAVPTGGASV